MPVKVNIHLICRSFLSLAFLFILFDSTVFGQDDCELKLQEAREFYDQGLIEKIPQLLFPCIEEGFTRSQRMEAYKLIILAYLLDYDQAEAERAMVEFLRKYPEYEIMSDDPIEFVYLFESYRTTSVFSVGGAAGLNFTDPRIIEPFTALDLENSEMKNSMKTGFQIGLGAARYISRNMLLNIELYFAENHYSFTNNLSIELSDGTEVINEVTYNEKLYKLEVPLTMAYEFNIGNLNYFVRAGLAAAKITGVSGQPSRKYAQDSPPVTGEYTSSIDYRKGMFFSAIAGAGIRYKVPRGVITVDLRANFGLNNIVKKELRYQNPALLTKYYYVDDDFSLNTLSISAGYYFSFYTPSKER